MLALPRFQRFRAASGRLAQTAFGLFYGHWRVPMVASDQATENAYTIFYVNVTTILYMIDHKSD